MRVREWQIRGSGCGFGLALALAVTSALAVDGNVYNGSECTFAESGEYDGQERNSMKLWNRSGQAQTFSCPLTRDQTTNDVEYVYIIGSNAISESTCRFWEREDDFTYQSWTHDSIDAETASYNKTRWFDSTSYAATTDWASYQITCDVPDDGGVYNYYLEEK